MSELGLHANRSDRERTTSAPPAAHARTAGGALRTQLKSLGYAAQEAALTPVQRKRGGGAAATDAVHDAAARGTAGSGGALPHAEAIQASFGAHDVSGVHAHTDGAAQAASREMGAEAFASGDHVAFGAGATDLHTVAHEAAHVVQQRAGVSLAGGVGQSGDAYEAHADEVADRVVQGKSAEPLLDRVAGGRAGRGGGGAGVQRRAVQRVTVVQKKEAKHKAEIERMSQSDLEKVLRVQEGDQSPWEKDPDNVGKMRDDKGRPDDDWKLSKWTKEDFELAKELARSMEVGAKVEGKTIIGQERGIEHQGTTGPDGARQTTTETKKTDVDRGSRQEESAKTTTKGADVTRETARTNETKNADGTTASSSQSTSNHTAADGSRTATNASQSTYTNADGKRQTDSSSRTVSNAADGSLSDSETSSKAISNGAGQRDVVEVSSGRTRTSDGAETIAEGTPTRRTEDEAGEGEAAEGKKKGKGIKTGGTIAEYQKEFLDEALAQYNKKFELGGGLSVTLEGKLGSLSGKVNAGVSVGEAKERGGADPDQASGEGGGGDGGGGGGGEGGGKEKTEQELKAEAKLSLAANAIEGKMTIEWGGDTTVFGEDVGAKVYGGASFSVGAEVAASVDAGAKLGSMKGGAKGIDTGAALEGEAFAGAKGSLSLGARLDWKKKAPKAYGGKMAESADAIMKFAATMVGGPVGYMAAELANILGADELIGFVMEKALDWGPAGDIALFLLEGKLEGSAGIGAKGGLDVGFSGGKVRFKCFASVTFGLGGGGSVDVLVDSVQGPLFLILVAGHALNEVENWLKDKLRGALQELGDLGGRILDWLDADNKAIKLIQNGGHTVLSAADRARLIDKMLDWRVDGETEDALIEVFRFSADHGDIGSVVSAMDASVKDLLSAVDGDNYETLNAVLAESYVWMVKIGVVGRAWDTQVKGDDPAGPYIYFQNEDEAGVCDITGGETVEESESSRPGYNYYVMMDDMNHAVKFHELDGTSGESLMAGFETPEEAREASYGGGGVWPEKK